MGRALKAIMKTYQKQLLLTAVAIVLSPILISGSFSHFGFMKYDGRIITNYKVKNETFKIH